MHQDGISALQAGDGMRLHLKKKETPSQKKPTNSQMTVIILDQATSWLQVSLFTYKIESNSRGSTNTVIFVINGDKAQ